MKKEKTSALEYAKDHKFSYLGSEYQMKDHEDNKEAEDKIYFTKGEFTDCAGNKLELYKF